MTLSKRDRRALLILAVAAAVLTVVRLSLSGPVVPPLVTAGASIPAAEKSLAKARQLADALPARQAARKALEAALAEREKGVIQADTLPQAQAQLLQIAHRLAAAQIPPIEIRSEVGQARPLSDQYGEILLPLNFNCRIEQLVNLLADVTAQPELLATSALRIGMNNALDKTISVRLSLSGVVPSKLVPEKKGSGLL